MRCIRVLKSEHNEEDVGDENAFVSYGNGRRAIERAREDALIAWKVIFSCHGGQVDLLDSTRRLYSRKGCERPFGVVCVHDEQVHDDECNEELLCDGIQWARVKVELDFCCINYNPNLAVLICLDSVSPGVSSNPLTIATLAITLWLESTRTKYARLDQLE
ncbi:unnamed protein product [Protopolystoma xenopodis]|uniref:Uncharacterized protein n=1 Tax=Protopolystoma xenopodis TaxID=117903 RepID=A0A3S5AN74_9PLAT|nr:unnamed protein product [Protopolystoma xenopodis]